MFGYVLVNQKALSEPAFARYRQSYCGLCRRLGELHGLRGRMTLSYDLTFLDILLCSLYEGEIPEQSGQSRCPAHPFKPQNWRSAAPTDYCADMSVALHYYSAQDKWQDDRSIAGRALMTLLKNRLPEIRKRWPVQCEVIRTELAELNRLEAENCQQPDVVSACFGRLMAALFLYQQDHWSRELETIGMTLGQFIYLLDAADDLEKDQKKHHYNPLYQYSEAPDWKEALQESLQGMMAQCTAAFEVLPCVADSDILRNILYSGVWSRWPFPAKQADSAKEDAEKDSTTQN